MTKPTYAVRRRRDRERVMALARAGVPLTLLLDLSSELRSAELYASESASKR